MGKHVTDQQSADLVFKALEAFKQERKNWRSVNNGPGWSRVLREPQFIPTESFAETADITMEMRDLPEEEVSGFIGRKAMEAALVVAFEELGKIVR